MLINCLYIKYKFTTILEPIGVMEIVSKSIFEGSMGSCHFELAIEELQCKSEGDCIPSEGYFTQKSSYKFLKRTCIGNFADAPRWKILRLRRLRHQSLQYKF